MIQLHEPTLDKYEKKLLLKSFKKNFISSYGPYIDKFQKKFSYIYGFKNCFAVNSGTSAIHLALLASGVSKNDLVITQSYTFAASTNAILYCNAEPWFFDISKKNYSLDLELVDKILEKNSYLKNGHIYNKKTHQRVMAIMPVFSFGIPIDYKKLKKISKKYKLKIICDAAAAHGALKFFKKEKPIKGFFCFSFNGNKTLTSGNGGMICTNEKNYNNYINSLINVGKQNKNYHYNYVGYNYRLSSLLAVIGISQLLKIREILKKKNNVFKTYDKLIKNTICKSEVKNKDFVQWLYFLTLKKNLSKKILIYLKSKKINTHFFWKPLHQNKPYKKFLKERLNYTNYIWKKILVLPSHLKLNKPQINHIVKSINRVL